jgi:hypothetical protein
MIKNFIKTSEILRENLIYFLEKLRLVDWTQNQGTKFYDSVVTNEINKRNETSEFSSDRFKSTRKKFIKDIIQTANYLLARN